MGGMRPLAKRIPNGRTTARSGPLPYSSRAPVRAGWTDGKANWKRPRDWSAGLPTALSDVVINTGGNPQVTASFGTVNSIADSGGLDFIDAGASSVTAGVAVSAAGELTLDASNGAGGSSLMIGGALSTSGGWPSHPEIVIGNSSLSAASSVEASSLNNCDVGSIVLNGSREARATMKVGTLTNAAGAREFKGKPIPIYGYIVLNNDASLTTTHDATNSGVIELSASSGEGGSSLTVGGTLTNSRTIAIGNGTLSAASTVKAASLENSGTIDLTGSSTAEATLNVTGALENSGTIYLTGSWTAEARLTVAGAFTNDGSVNLSQDADTLAGAIGGTGSFSLSNGSKLEFGSAVSSGEAVTFGAGLTPDRLILDQPSSFNGTIDDFFTKGDLVGASTFAFSHTTFHYTQTGAESCSWTLTDGAKTAVLNFAGGFYRKSDFSIVSANGGAGSAIKFVGPSDYWTDGTANWNTPGDWSGGIPTASSDVVINAEGNPQATASFGTVHSITDLGVLSINGGASSVTAGVAVAANWLIVTGASLTIGGPLTNFAQIQIGPSSTVKAASLDNSGFIYVGPAATLNVTGMFTNDGEVDLSDVTDKLAGAIGGAGAFELVGNSELEFGSTVSSGVTVNFVNSPDELILDQPLAFQGTIGEAEFGFGLFGAGDQIDFPTLAYAKGDHAVDTNGKVAIETSAGKTVATFNVSGTYTSANFSVGKDASGDVLVTYAATAANAADLLGRYGSAFAEPPSTPTSDARAFDAWTALGSSAGAFSGDFDFHHDGNPGGARDVWGVSVGWNGSTGHGPGPS